MIENEKEWRDPRKPYFQFLLNVLYEKARQPSYQDWYLDTFGNKSIRELDYVEFGQVLTWLEEQLGFQPVVCAMLFELVQQP